MGLELNPRIPRRGDAAFVNGTFVDAGFGRLEEAEPQLCHRQQRERKRHRHRSEEGKKRIGVSVHDWKDETPITLRSKTETSNAFPHCILSNTAREEPNDSRE